MSHAYQIADYGMLLSTYNMMTEARGFARNILYGKDAIHSLKGFVDRVMRAVLAMVMSLCKNPKDPRTTCHRAAVPSWSEPKPS
jgi:hypothetical protein